MLSVVWMTMGPTWLLIVVCLGRIRPGWRSWVTGRWALELQESTDPDCYLQSVSLCASRLWTRVEPQLPLQQHSFLLAAVVPAVINRECWVWTNPLKLWARLHCLLPLKVAWITVSFRSNRTVTKTLRIQSNFILLQWISTSPRILCGWVCPFLYIYWQEVDCKRVNLFLG